MLSIGEAFGYDHRRLEQAIEASVADARSGRWEAAAEAFAAFRRGIERHMEVEEQVLFPAVEGEVETPLTAILRKGHRDLRAFFDEIDDALQARDAEECTRCHDEGSAGAPRRERGGGTLSGRAGAPRYRRCGGGGRAARPLMPEAKTAS